MSKGKKANRLIHETSPYLLQHAHNPVDWYPWGDEALQKAVKEDKPILVSIGYSACHWCHVMERESFENDQVADFLNLNFVAIKVDREEKPDVDQVYMDAVQAMGIQGGWPLNVFLTPEQKPFFGGTYFPMQSFMDILNNVVNAFTTKREKLNLSAEQLANHLSKSEVIKFGLTELHPDIGLDALDDGVHNLQKAFDHEFGGFDKAPKFPMPSLWIFLLRYAHFTGNRSIMDHCHFTLKHIARGGIYDQIGGGFARYSVDSKWFVPHFEKMLYDNGQLLSLYAEAYVQSRDEEYKRVILETIRFLEEELMADDGGCYAALDADSEGVEGKYYIWDMEEFKASLKEDQDFWANYFGLKEAGNWEHGQNILVDKKGLTYISEGLNIPLEEAAERLAKVKADLRQYRMKRVRPGLDNKRLAGWNGMALSGLIDSYNAILNEDILSMALKNAGYLVEKHINGSQLFRTPLESKPVISGYLEDYAFVIQAFIKLYQATFSEGWLLRAKELMMYTTEHFYDEKEGFFYFTDKNEPQLIATKKEIFDNVIPSSNAVMAENLFLMGLLLDIEQFLDMAERMVSQMKRMIISDTEYTSYWATVFLMMSQPMAEIAILGKDMLSIRASINRQYHPNKVFCGAAESSGLPLLKDRPNLKDNTIYVCYNKTCKLPVHTADEALERLQ